MSPYWEDCFGIVSKQEYSSGEGGDPLGKFIILSFSDGEDTVFANTVTALASVADFSTVAASADAPLLFSSLQIDPQRRLVWQSGQTVDLTPMEFDILLLLPARSMRLLRRTPLMPAGRGSPAWSINSDASWGLASLKRCGATATNSSPQAPHQNKTSAQRIFFRCALLLFLTPVMRLRHIRLLLVFAIFFRYFGRLLQAFRTVINRLITNSVQQNALQMLKF